MMGTDRRSFLAVAGAAAWAGSANAAGRRAVRLGGPIFLKSEDPEELAREHRRLGYSAAYCPQAKAEDARACAPSRRPSRPKMWRSPK